MHAQGDAGCITERDTALGRGLAARRDGDRRPARAAPEHGVVREARSRRHDLPRQVDEVATVARVFAASQRQLPKRPALARPHEDRTRAVTGLAVVSGGANDRVPQTDRLARPGEHRRNVDGIEGRRGGGGPVRRRDRGQRDSPDDTCNDPGRSPRERPDAWSAHGIPPGRDRSDGTRPTPTRG